MEKLLNNLFPQGKRKLVVSVAALALAFVLEKYMGGLTEEMMTSIIAIVAIFATGNVGEHIADAVKVVKGTKVGQTIDTFIPGDQGLMDQNEDQVEAMFVARIESLEENIRELRAANEKTSTTVGQLAGVLQRMLNNQQGAAQGGGQQRPG